jgi:lysylphosphatidylglycerol synthetase-like protein (DUF2156 family)
MLASNQSTTVLDYPRKKSSIRLFPRTIDIVSDSGVTKAFSFEERIRYLRKYGNHCMSYSALQPGMQYFDIPGKGYIAYMEKWGSRFALADPICDEKDREAIIGAFIKDNRNCGFIQVSEPVAELINRKFGFYATQFGVESIVDLSAWDLKGKKKQVLRTSINHAQKKGITVVEKYDEKGDVQLSQEWLKTRKVKKREILFLIRPMSMDYNVGTRKFFAYQRGKLLGFIFFDPVFSNDKSFRQGIFYTIMAHAMETFKEEGVEQIHLGLSPLVTDNGDKPYESQIVKKAIRLLYEYANQIYNFKGIYFTKSRFRGTDYRTFCCHESMLPVKKFLTIFKIANVF